MAEILYLGKNEINMNEIFDELYHAVSEKEEFTFLDSILTEECEKRLQPYRERLSSRDYEDIRDVVFSISYKSKKGAFGIGFKTAVRMFLICRSSDPVI